MAKRSLEWNENKLQRFLKEGRGKGISKDYLPWLTVQDVPSQGRISRVFSHKSQRIHHLFSDMETRVFYLFLWEDAVCDIREHYPLLNMEDVISDKKCIDFGKFVDKETGTPYVLTTTFLITLKGEDGKEYYIARSVKLAEKLEQKYIIERYEVERRYWDSKGVDWGIITQKDINIIKAKNIEWVYQSILDCEIESSAKSELSEKLLNDLLNKDDVVRKITASFDLEQKLQPGTGLFLFKNLIASKMISLDMEKEVNVNIPLSQLL